MYIFLRISILVLVKTFQLVLAFFLDELNDGFSFDEESNLSAIILNVKIRSNIFVIFACNTFSFRWNEMNTTNATGMPNYNEFF